jgi:alkylation response protein AidB-like acyl-CoA dehydrogenase
MTDINFFKSDLREMEFALFEQARLQELLAAAPYDHLSEEEARMVLKEAHAFAAEVIAPTLSVTDREGCHLTPEGVRVPAAFREVWKRYFENGWQAVTLPEARGGMAAPHLLGTAVVELMSGANTAFYIYPSLTQGAAGLIAGLGTPEQRELYLSKLESGQWGGTMVLTEPQAGSDVGLSTTKAVPSGDGSYAITGNKIFISGGDHDLAENIVHLALARIEGAPKGTRGLSLFIIPKFRVNPDGSLGEPNDVTCTHIEHKLGIHGSATCALSFGEKGRCQGWLLGGAPKAGDEPGAGIRKMFLLMNGARIGVGTQSLALASTAYLNALEYARQRLQGAHHRKGRPERGAVPIIEHPDVRRMLMEMKAQVEGCRALLYHAVRLEDEASAAQANAHGGGAEQAEALREDLSLYIPLVKAYISDVAVQVSSLALQVYGGAGYTKDFPAEQYYRDSRIFPIYEGTNGIQAIDLVGRKLSQSGGALVQRFLKAAGASQARIQSASGYEREAQALAQGLAAVQKVLGQYMSFFAADRRELILVSATRFLELMSRTVCAWLLLDGALIAEAALKPLSAENREREFYLGKIAAARYFARNLLPPMTGLAEAIAAGDDTALAIPDGAFSLTY